MAESALKTALYDEHRRLGAKMVPFGGWLMPVSYTSVLKEHEWVRTKVGVFDVSHMGEVSVNGADAAAFLQWLTINDVHKLAIGEGQYSALCRPSGGMVDDLILYRTGEASYFLCVNASNTEKDVQWISEQARRYPKLTVSNESEAWSQLAVQGPASQSAVERLLSEADRRKLAALAYTHITDVTLAGLPAKIARTGYTGEKGYELYMPPRSAVPVWQALLGLSSELGLAPIGLGARDTLRLEACYLLYGNDMNDEVSPLEAGIGWATKLTKGDFLGRDALVSQKEKGVPRQIHAFHMEEQGIPRQGMDLYSKGSVIGRVTSGSVLPSIGGAGGLALLNSRSVSLGDLVSVDIRGKMRQARIVKRPFYQGKVKD